MAARDDEVEPDPAIGPANEKAAGHVGETLGMARRLAADVAELAALEARLAGATVFRLLWLALVVAVCLIWAWGLLLVALTLGLSNLDWAPWGIACILAGINAVLAYFLIRRILALTRLLTFEATRRTLLGSADR